jgi:hypothetical protein
MRWAGHVASKAEMGNIYEIFVIKPEMKGKLDRQA